MQTLTAEAFKKKYGDDAVKQFTATPQPKADPFNPFPTDPAQGNYGTAVKDAFNSSVDYAKQGVSQIASGKNLLQKGEGLLKVGGGVAGALGAPIAPVLSGVINKAGEGYATLPAVQKFGNSKAGEVTARVAEDVSNAGAIAGLAAGGIKGGKGAPTALKATGEAVTGAAKSTVDSAKNAVTSTGDKAGSATSYIKSAVHDVLPNTQTLINHEVSKALDLTPSDLSNLSKSTGNDAGTWLSDHNLIGTNKETTQKNIQNFFTQNYDTVRSEIGKVDTVYKPYQIPRYIDSLKQIQKQIRDVPGLEKENVVVDNLINKKDLSLGDVQTAKELMDKHFNLYKVTGDVSQGVAKEGLANMRSELKTFIEDQVQEKTGADIKALNNNVSTARSLNDAIETRSPKGLTRSHISMRDAMMGLGLTYFGSPVLGLAAVAMSKILSSPTVRLRIARYLDTLSDAHKRKISLQLKEGKVPAELDSMINQAPLPPGGGDMVKNKK